MMLSAEIQRTLLETLAMRFERQMHRHAGVEWSAVRARLEARPETLAALYAMEQTGGEPDVVGYDAAADRFVFYDCAAESPIGRRSLCYDQAARQARKTAPPAGSAIEMAAALGIELLTEADYDRLQALGEFDTKTSSWLQTPPEIRHLGGALFGDRRYNRVFIYHNGAQSYYAARGFRGVLRV